MTSVATAPAVEAHWANVPNALSAIRFVLAMIVCALIETEYYTTAMICFLVAASTDWMDGYWARKYNQVTKLGRILDPFVDKIIIAGAMIALVGATGSGMAPWMATVVIGRELLVTSLRGLIEGQGGDFSAKQLGKWKMVAQCAAVVACLLVLRQLPDAPEWLLWTRTILVWFSVAITIASGVDYIFTAIRMSQKARIQAS